MRRLAGLGCLLLLLAACASGGGTTGGSTVPSTPAWTPARTGASTTSSGAAPAARTASPVAAGWTPAHVVVVVEENHSYADIVNATDAPYLHQLAAQGVSLDHMYAVTHPSQPNYVAMFSGSTHGLTSDSCPHAFTGATLAAQLATAHRTFVGYSEGLPKAGDTACTAGRYARKHAPWTDFPALPAATGQPLTAFPTDFTKLPAVSYVIPDLDHDMHDGTIAQADTWLRTTLGGYATWARTHNSILVVTWDEDDRSAGNQIPTILYGAHVRTGVVVHGHTDHYRMLRTVEWLFGLPGIGAAANRTPVTGAFT